VQEGAVGAGTGTVAFGWKGGIGTSSRKLPDTLGGYTLGILVQTNFGGVLSIDGVPIGVELGKYYLSDAVGSLNPKSEIQNPKSADGSIIIVIATDAPLIPTQLKRLARRAGLGLARDGSIGGNGSGDIFIAFSTANPGAAKPTGIASISMLPNDRMNPLFAATIQSVEEAVVNAMVAADTMTGVDGYTAKALPQDELVRILKKYGRLREPPNSKQ